MCDLGERCLLKTPLFSDLLISVLNNKHFNLLQQYTQEIWIMAKPKGIQSSIIEDKQNQQIFTFERLKPVIFLAVLIKRLLK